jgi:hypothetical protein
MLVFIEFIAFIVFILLCARFLLFCISFCKQLAISAVPSAMPYAMHVPLKWAILVWIEAELCQAGLPALPITVSPITPVEQLDEKATENKTKRSAIDFIT